MRKLHWGVLGVIVMVALGIGSTGGNGPLSITERTNHIASEVRCPTCRGLSAAESDAVTARAVRDEIERRLIRGESESQIKAFLVSRYGSDVLLRPGATSGSWLVWALPVLAAGAGALIVGGALYRWRARGRMRSSSEDRVLVEKALQA